jgi:hypothetical protein
MFHLLHTCVPHARDALPSLARARPNARPLRRSAPHSFQEASAIKVEFLDVESAPDAAAKQPKSVTSLLFQHLYLEAASRCWNYRSAADLPYCNALANMCVLSGADRSLQLCKLYEVSAHPGL